MARFNDDDAAVKRLSTIRDQLAVCGTDKKEQGVSPRALNLRIWRDGRSLCIQHGKFTLNLRNLHKVEFITHSVGISHLGGYIRRLFEKKITNILNLDRLQNIFHELLFFLFLYTSSANRNEQVS